MQDKNVMDESDTTARIKQSLALPLFSARLDACLQRFSDDASSPEEGSDAWLFVQALISDDESEFIDRFELSGRGLAELGGKLDTRLEGMQRYIDALGEELKDIFCDEPALCLEATSMLFRIHSACVMALTRGYQSVIERVSAERDRYSQRLSQRLLALQHINAVSNSTVDLDQTLELTAQTIAHELDTELCSIFFYNELQRMLTLHSTNGPRPLGGMHFTLRLGEGYSGWVADQGRPLIARDAMIDPVYAAEARTYSVDYHGLMVIPIIFFGSTERLIGVISVQSAEPRDFTSEEINFVEVIAGIIAINIENGRLYEQTDEQLRRKVHELATMHRVSSIIASTLNLDEVLQIITTQAVHLSGAERSCIFELDADKQHLHALAHYGLEGFDVLQNRVKVGECCAGRTVQTGRPSMAVDCPHNDQHCIFRNDPTLTSGIHSVLCVPLEVKQKVLGCICIYSSHRHLLSPEQMQLVITFANEAAIAIDNARLYEETRRGLELKSVLLRELHHRVKNNLATVAGILSLQRRRTKSEEVRYILGESVNRVQGLAATHDLLAHEDVSEARVDDIARKIVGVANANLRPPDSHITFRVEPCSVVIPSRAVAILALVLNEMVSNAIKHGMAGITEGTVIIRGAQANGIVTVQVSDSGKGFPEMLSEEDNSEGLGLSLIRNLIGDLGGRFTLRREKIENEAGAVEERTVSEVRFPLERRTRA